MDRFDEYVFLCDCLDLFSNAGGIKRSAKFGHQAFYVIWARPPVTETKEGYSTNIGTRCPSVKYKIEQKERRCSHDPL